MINRDIKVEYMIDKESGKIFSYKEVELKLRNKELDFQKYLDNYTEHTITFHKFTNKGKVSKSDQSNYQKVDELAEKLLRQQLEVEADTENDMLRAQKLARIINSANFNSRMTVIKEKTSHSKWYKEGDVLNSPSTYLTLVPSSVAKEAKQLQLIRQKHQNNPKFDFSKTEYHKKVIRVADHDNNNNSVGYVDLTKPNVEEQLRKQFDWML